MLIHFDKAGPMMKYVLGVLVISDLNPEASLTWRLKRWQMMKIGFRFLLAAIKDKGRW